jgi:hypothetical protein
MYEDDAENQPTDPIPPEQADSDNKDAEDERLIEIVNSEPRPPERSIPLLSRFRSSRRPTVFTIRNLDQYRVAFRVSGARSYQSEPMQGWQIDFGSLNVQINDLGRFIATYHHQDDNSGRAAWRHTAQEIGVRVYRGLMNTDVTLAQYLTAALRRTVPPENLTLVFEGVHDYLSVPYELLYDGREPLALRHPICRRITGFPAARRPGFHTLVEALTKTGAPLKVLLMTSGARAVAADQEVELLETCIQGSARHIRLNTIIDTASYRTVKQKLAASSYHIVHYAGQVYHDRLCPDNSGLLFTTGHDAQMGQALLTRRELFALLQHNTPDLFFASACFGPQEWDGDIALRDSNYLGLFDTLAQIGISYTIGFRWYVSNEGRLRFVQRFYESLFSAPFAPERAILHARQAVHRWDSHDETWASPMLIAQPDQDKTP